MRLGNLILSLECTFLLYYCFLSGGKLSNILRRHYVEATMVSASHNKEYLGTIGENLHQFFGTGFYIWDVFDAPQERWSPMTTEAVIKDSPPFSTAILPPLEV